MPPKVRYGRRTTPGFYRCTFPNKTPSPATQLDALTALVYLAQTQTIESLDSALPPLLAFRSLPLLLADLSLKFDTSNFLRLFLTGLLSHW